MNIGTFIAKIDFDIPNMKAFVMGIPVSFTISEIGYNQLGVTTANKPSGFVHPYFEWKIINS